MGGRKSQSPPLHPHHGQEEVSDTRACRECCAQGSTATHCGAERGKAVERAVAKGHVGIHLVSNQRDVLVGSHWRTQKNMTQQDTTMSMADYGGALFFYFLQQTPPSPISPQPIFMLCVFARLTSKDDQKVILKVSFTLFECYRIAVAINSMRWIEWMCPHVPLIIAWMCSLV